MKSFEQLAQAAYEAASKKAIEVGLREKGESPTWDRLQPELKQGWVAAAQQLWAEFAAMH